VEAQLLLQAVRDESTLPLADLSALAAAIDDWDAVIDLATRHRVLAYLRQALTATAVRPPRETERDLGKSLIGVASGIVRLKRRLEQIAAVFADNDIPLLVLKGPVLAPLLYPTPVFRPYADLDLMVHSADLARASRALEEVGLREIVFEPEAARRESSAHLECGAEYHSVFVSADDAELVELHVDVLQLGLRLSPEQARWDRAIPAPDLPGAVMLAMPDQLVGLAVHAQKHGYNRLIWLKDLDLLVRRTGLDWDRVVEIARFEGVTASVWYALELVQALLATPVPPEVLRQLRPALPLRALYKCVWPPRAIVELRGHMRRRAVQFHVADSWRGMLPSLILMGHRRMRAGAILHAIVH
jgi:hypothetical protein